jgi:hypothetical protein
MIKNLLISSLEKKMLQLRPSCEHCDKDLPPHAHDAMICSFECTFCVDCVNTKLRGVCPNCGGNFTNRPIRPLQLGRNNNDLAHYPAQTKRVFKPVDLAKHVRDLTD